MIDKTTLKVTLSCIALGALSRLLPHPANVTPVTAMALLGGAYLTRGQALVLPLAVLFLSDLVLGLHGTIPFVYASFLATAMLGQVLKRKMTAGTTMAACLGGTAILFVVSNFGVWLTSGMYTRDASGLAACYAAALPFLRNSLIGDVAYTALLFGIERASLGYFAAKPVPAAA